MCFVTKAVHLELVSDLTTEAFLAALRRFFARRGLSKTIYSDNGTTFQGAKSELARFLKDQSSEFISELSNQFVDWVFIPPPRAPHFGGLWEAGVKSVKHHLKRVIGETSLTFEQFTTVLCQVEACLNSRPLSPLSSHPSDLQPLTPAHFLVVLKPIIALPTMSTNGSTFLEALDEGIRRRTTNQMQMESCHATTS